MQTLASVSTSIDINHSIQSSEFYEAAILADETEIDNYWYLGVSYLLAGREDDAQATWFVPLSGDDVDEVDSLTNELLIILDREAKNQAQVADFENAWLLRQHLWSIAPDRIENILQLISLASQLELLTEELLIEWQITKLLKLASTDDLDHVLLEGAIVALFQGLRDDLGLDIIKSCLQSLGDRCHILIEKIIVAAFNLCFQRKHKIFAIKLAEICQALSPNNLEIYKALVLMYSDSNFHARSITTAEQYNRLVSNPIDKLFGSYLIQRSGLASGDWGNGIENVNKHCISLQNIINSPPEYLTKQQILPLIVSSVFLAYSEDNPRKYRILQNQIAEIYQNNIDLLVGANTNSPNVEESFNEKPPDVLRIGYIASTLRAHSVGWLSRWLFQYHDRQLFQIFNYYVNQHPHDTFNHQWFRDKVDVNHYCGNNPEEIAAQIKADKVDILIDLDSLTLDISCLVMAYKPAPVQVTWLGWDASGSPSIDYFIADPYVLPDHAQDYYQEKIWRLPQTYLGVEGFEVGIPTLRREDLDIPADAIVYFSSQTGYKRHPDCIKAQMEIIKAVPNSYFLIKGKSDPETIQNFFGKLATEVGISLDRLRFLDQVTDEATHRANLAIADIVLDTFPYNGATTTLETLWMGIPMVTQVGQQFAARNSYTFMLNAGIEEGIAWSQEEYIEWGIKLGLDRELRDKIAGKLRSGRTTAPVWNAKQFTLDMEDAYRQMWAKYQAELN
jgi:predicted O-linked N-acetylglucosamine transferase (SPINDLY family)